MKVAIYARTSTDDGRQDLTNQTRDLRAYSEQMGWTVVAEFHDQISGRKAGRPELEKALEAGSKRKFDVLLFWSLDRISREGVLKTLQILKQLSEYGVGFRSHQERYIDSLGPFKDAVIGILATIATLESDRISSRVRSGLARAKAQGKTLGRPRTVVNRDKLAAMREKGMSLREIAVTTGTSAMTVQRLLKTERAA